MDWSVLCPACGGPGKVLRDALGDEQIVCDAYAPCSGEPSWADEAAEYERQGAAFLAASSTVEDAKLADLLRRAADEADKHTDHLRRQHDAELRAWQDRLREWGR